MMKDWYSKLKIEYRVVVWSLIVIASIMILTIPLFFFSLMEIPQGIALGGVVSVIIYIFLGLFNNQDQIKKSVTITIVIIVIKSIVITGLLFLVGWLYYGIGFKAFNIFAVAGGYLIPLVTHIILVGKERSVGNS